MFKSCKVLGPGKMELEVIVRGFFSSFFFGGGGKNMQKLWPNTRKNNINHFVIARWRGL